MGGAAWMRLAKDKLFWGEGESANGFPLLKH